MLYMCYSVKLNTTLNLMVMILIIWMGEFRLREINVFLKDTLVSLNSNT